MIGPTGIPTNSDATSDHGSDGPYRQAFDSLPMAMAILDEDADILSVNAEWRRFGAANGGATDGYVGYNYLNVCRAADDTDAADAHGLIRAVLAGERRNGQLEYPCHAPTEHRWFLMQVWSFDDGGRFRVAVMHLNITRRRRLEDALRERADRDGLTGLLNRASFEERGEQALARARRNGEPVSLLFLDLNKFKSVNDTWGHEIGDMVLHEVAARLRQGVRDTDAPARIGGDEFAVILEGTGAETAGRTAQRIKTLTGEPMQIEGRTFQLGCAVGIATNGDAHTTVRRLLQEADRAMYTEKER
mgnify:CR=1 FL=1